MLVICDCDGVLVESESLAAKAFSELLAQYGIALSPLQCEGLFIGKTLTQCIDGLHQMYPGCIPGDFRTQLDLITDELFANSLQSVPKVEAVLKALQQRGIPLAVASNGGWEKTKTNLARTGLLNYFGAAVFSADQVLLPKPAPDVYLAAAENLGVPAQFCWVIEDSDVGARAGLAAGMRVLLFRPPWRNHTTPVPAGVELVTDMQQVLQRLLS